MFVHLGGEVVVDIRQVVAILDARRLQHTPETRLLLERGKRGPGEKAAVVWEEARAVVVTTRGVYPAPISPETVAKRIREVGHFPPREKAER